MDCRDVMALVIGMDNEADLPPAAASHLSECAACAAEARLLDAAMGTLRIGAGESTDEDLADLSIEAAGLTERIMMAVRTEAASAGSDAEAEDQPAPLRNWIIPGTLLLGGLFGLRFSDVMRWLRASFGPALDVAMSLILGLFLTAYICMLVASNLGRVRRVFRLR